MARPLRPEKPYTPLDNHLLGSVLSPKHDPECVDVIADTPLTEVAPENRRVSRRRIASGQVRGLAVNSDESHTLSDSSFGRALDRNHDTSEQRMNATLRLKVAIHDKRDFEAFTARLAAALNTTLKPSNLLRAMLTVMQNAEVLLNDLARREKPLKRPPNDDAFAYAEFENRLVRMMDSAIRQSTPLPVMRAKP